MEISSSTRAAAYLFFFSLLVSHRLGSCASINQQGVFGESTTDDPTGSFSNQGVSCSDDGKVVALLLVGYKLSGELQTDLQKHIECLSDGGCAIQRRLLRSQDRQGLEEKRHVARLPKSTDPEPEKRTMPRWAIYTIAIGGALVFVAVAAAITYLLFSHRKKDITVMPWSTGLSGPLRKAFVSGLSLIIWSLWLNQMGTNH
ncbi:hypothetical protein BAE44_0019078 [Dichanthelium oligosanthes]|uniref:Uncharacterized protein n=1 Tax=Dichanthelium oligosanthes TaxID=888268 RepID=A0A1E5V423_9POAL|nr:hypothetical protein BAE44_0019078 [Dichanthelium oligosanthes]